MPVLYASQWFLTIYSCPFPATFACRVIDVMLTEHSSNVLMRAALAVLAECEDDLLQLHDFEDLITYLKVELLQLSPQGAFDSTVAARSVLEMLLGCTWTLNCKGSCMSRDSGITPEYAMQCVGYCIEIVATKLYETQTACTKCWVPITYMLLRLDP